MNDNLVLEENSHTYYLNNKQIDGLTQTIAEAGLMGNYGSEWHMDKGTAVHLATELWDKGTLDESTVDPQIQGYLESWKKFRKDQDYTPIYIEKSFYDPIYLYAGTIDRLPLCDLKSGQEDKWHKWQLAGYWNLCKVNGLEDFCRNPQCVYLDLEGGPPKVLSYTQSQMRDALKDFFIILSFVRLRRTLK